MDKKLVQVKDILDTYRDAKQLDEHWRLTSESIERGWLAYLGGTKEFNKK